MKRDEQACTAVPFHDGLAEHLTQIARIIHTELRKVLADEDLSAVESGVIMCLSTTKVDTAGRIARRMGVSRSLMSKAVDHLVRGGWIETKPDQFYLCSQNLAKASPSSFVFLYFHTVTPSSFFTNVYLIPYSDK